MSPKRNVVGCKHQEDALGWFDSRSRQALCNRSAICGLKKADSPYSFGNETLANEEKAYTICC